MDLNQRLMKAFEDSTENDSHLELPPLYQELSEINERYGTGQYVDRGGMKIIYKVYDTITKRHIAMASLSESADQELYDPFIREARLTALLTHPNIIPIYDIGIDPKGAPFFTMELKEGDSLQKILDKCADDSEAYLQRYTPEVLLNIFIKVCDAIAYSHSHKVIHLDLKPENIQVGRFGEVLVCDWGLGKVLGHPTIDSFDELLFNPDFLNNATLFGAIKGTPGFMSPEQISKDGEKSPQSDIYALGCMLYSMLHYTAPFNGTTDEILKKTLTSQVSFSRGPNVPDGLSSIIKKAMQLNPDDRYLMVEHMRDDVQKYLLGFAPSSENASFFRQLKLFYKRNKIPCISVIVFTLLLSVFTTIFFINIDMKRREAEQARILAEEKRQEAATQKLRAENSLKVANSEKQRAKKALGLYRSERKWRETILSDHRDLLENDVLDYLFYSSLDKDPAEHMARTFTYLDRLIEAYPKRKELYAKRARANFMMQNFKAAQKDFIRAKADDHKNLELQKLSEKYAPLFDSPELPPELVPQFIKDLAQLRDGYVQYKVFNCFLIKKRPMDKTIQYAKLILKYNNPKWDAESFQYKHELKTLTLSGKNLKKIGYSYHNHISDKGVMHTAYDFLPVKYLIIKDMPSFPKNFYGSKINNIDISQSAVMPTQNLLEMKKLQKLYVNEQQDKYIQTLNNHQKVKVIISH